MGGGLRILLIDRTQLSFKCKFYFTKSSAFQDTFISSFFTAPSHSSSAECARNVLSQFLMWHVVSFCLTGVSKEPPISTVFCISLIKMVPERSVIQIIIIFIAIFIPTPVHVYFKVSATKFKGTNFQENVHRSYSEILQISENSYGNL